MQKLWLVLRDGACLQQSYPRGKPMALGITLTRPKLGRSHAVTGARGAFSAVGLPAAPTCPSRRVWHSIHRAPGPQGRGAPLLQGVPGLTLRLQVQEA